MLQGEEHPFATRSSTYLAVYCFSLDAIPNDGEGLPGVVRRGPLEVCKWKYDTTDLEYGMPTDAWSLTLLAAKRLSVKLWHRTTHDGNGSVVVTEERHHELRDGTWVGTSEEP